MALKREYPLRPWVGVGVIVWHGERVLLIRRGQEPGRGQWGIPGGAQQLGETVFDAAAREVQEETGLSVDPYAVVTVVDGIHRDEDGEIRFHYTLVEVAAECVSGADPVAADDVCDARWVSLGEVPNWVDGDATLRVIFQSAEQRRPRRPDSPGNGAPL